MRGQTRVFLRENAENKKMKFFEFCPLTICEDRLKSLLSVGDNETQAKLSSLKSEVQQAVATG